MIRSIAVGFLLAALASGPLAPAMAKSDRDKGDKPPRAAKANEKATAEKTVGGKLVEVFGDWTASIAQGKVKTCYALAKPKERTPDGKHDQAYVFIADRPAEKVRNEVSIIMGFPIKEGTAAKAKVGKTTFDLVAVSNAFFMKDAAEDTHFVDVLKRGGALVVKAPPAKGPVVTDTYSLNGFKQALDRAQKECR